MDPVTLTTNILAVLMPYVTKKAEQFVQEAGEAAYEKAKNLFHTLKARWTGDKEATDQLARFEEKPERYHPVLEDILQEKLAQDKDLAGELARLLEEMGPSLDIIQEMEEAKQVTGLRAKKMKKGKATVKQKAKKAEDMTGIEIDEIG